MNTTTSLQLKPYGYIYKVTNNFNGKCYIGQSIKNPSKSRWPYYKRLNCIGQHKLYNALKKYGPDNFAYEIIATGFDKENLDFLEDIYEIWCDSIKNGYNIIRGGSHGKIPEAKRHKGFKMTKESISKRLKTMGNYKLSPEHKLKISNALKGIKRSTETKQKMSERQIGEKNHMWEKKVKHTYETKHKISLASKNISDETREKRSKSLKGRIITEEWRKKISETLKKRNQSSTSVILHTGPYSLTTESDPFLDKMNNILPDGSSGSGSISPSVKIK